MMTSWARGPWRRLAIGATVAGLGGALLLSSPARAANPSHQPDMPWLTVSHPSGQRAEIVDPAGRTVMLRGVNLVGIEDDFYATPSGAEPGPAPIWPIDPAAYDGRCPTMSHYAAEAPVCEVDAGRPADQQSVAPGSHNDLAQMRALGFNFIRLGLSWSRLEPTPGVYSQQYLARVAQVVGWAKEQGIYVLLDMHQDNYSRYTPETAPVSVPPVLTPVQESANHADGAPPWAVVVDGEPALAPGGVAELNAYVAASFDSFWHNRVPTDRAGHPRQSSAGFGAGLEDHYIGAMAALARRFKTDSTVAGYEIMNEPLPGFTPPGLFSTTELYPFYSRVISALTKPSVGVTRQSFFFEPMAVRNLEDAPDQLSLPFSNYPNLVYAPHTYTHVFTVDAAAGVPPGQSPYPVSYDQALQVADLEARSMGAALLPDEYGGPASEDNVILGPETAAQDKARVGAAVYSWKASCSAGTKVADCYGGWSVYAGDPATPPAQNLGLIPSRVKFLSRVYPMSTAGQLDSFSYNPNNGSFSMTATADRAVPVGRLGEETVMFIPASVKAIPRASGAAVLDRIVVTSDGTRLAYVAPTRAGAYSVTLSGT
jgi:endoglycosylceramidase